MEGEWTVDKPFIIMTSERPLSKEERETRDKTMKQMKIVPFYTSLPETNLRPKRTEPQIIDPLESYLKSDEMKMRKEAYSTDYSIFDREINVPFDGSYN
ncbi:hypothetical protein pv_251 [Pithovirus sibericum]|uniref:Uncharacterized protein n=1 Tax=Pithovirus sibericum TaxID=1450746 RepID=W5S4X7_9VIRU|nr:hypothetical protein pv_251 [Pithovirus sibericum]AHH01818.1 hypothetical protein pv_251 [Pithovirus sibericum]